MATSLPEAVKREGWKDVCTSPLSAHQLPSYRVHSVYFVPVMAVRH